MDAELARRVDALFAPLKAAYDNGFARIRDADGRVLRAACDGVIAKAPTDALVAWREKLADWERLAVEQLQIEVARGMRLLARFPRAKALPAIASDDPLAAPTHSLPGIGPAFAANLAERGLETVEDLLWCLPRRYDDVRDAVPLAALAQLEDGQRATFRGKVASARMIFARGRRWAEVRLDDVDLSPPAFALGAPNVPSSAPRAGGTSSQGVGRPCSAGQPIDRTDSALVRWFNVWAGIDKRMPPGSDVTLSGAVRRRSGRLEFANPDILAIVVPDSDAAAKPAPAILARYPDIPGVPGSRLRAACRVACERIGALADDGVPAAVERAAGLPALGAALAHLHSPPADIAADELAAMNRGDSRWQRRLAFGELFALGVAVALRRRTRKADVAVPCKRTPKLDDAIDRALPFALTGAQRRVIAEIAGDLDQPVPMNRLLQGDVGSGKTAVAFAAALQVARAGRQTAIMAPTELLAEQHADTWRAWAKSAELRIDVLTGSTPKAVRQSMLSLLAAGQLDVLIGTHALLSEGVGFAALGLVVIDEQHRFGVAQRTRLRDKYDVAGSPRDGSAAEGRPGSIDGQGAPHLLVMTATPIPRTLALTAFGDLDASVVDELPPGRQPAKTHVRTGARGQAQAYKLIAERVAAGERAYVVCPKVDDTGETDSKHWKDATSVARELAQAMPALRVGLVHGRMAGDERDRAMRAFKAGALDVLVATTVIEVGVDVPAATVMVVHDAERFGLAQLHQLRGRVGRGGGVAHCVLLAQGAVSEDGRFRLDALVATSDGFQIAEQDLALRGPGELLGPRQAGVPRLRFGSLAQHTELLLEARRHADAVLVADPDLVRPEHAALHRALDRRLATAVYGSESG